MSENYIRLIKAIFLRAFMDAVRDNAICRRHKLAARLFLADDTTRELAKEIGWVHYVDKALEI